MANEGEEPPDFMEREDLQISCPPPSARQNGKIDNGQKEAGNLYGVAEFNATAQLTRLKAELRTAKTEEEFWPRATHGIAELVGAQFAFISKRMVVDNEDAMVEMPPYGAPGSCLMSQAFYYNDGHGNTGNPRSVKYQVYGAPCEGMKHGKVLLIPERLTEIFPKNPNAPILVVPPEAYLGIPLFDNEGKCFAHFGVMWSKEGLSKFQLSWAFAEMIFHSVEDTLLAGFLERGRFASALKAAAAPRTTIPHEAITAAQSLKPYARNLSHELRTPMQGVVGMLDVMYATVQEAAEGQNDRNVRAVFDNLKENIEVVQDSSRRAVEAADNVVHAYDMNMGVPDTPRSPPDEEDDPVDDARKKDRRPGIVVTGVNVPINFKGHKRKRDDRSESRGAHKQRRIVSIPEPQPDCAGLLPTPASISDPVQPDPFGYMSPTTAHLEMSEQVHIPPGLRHTNLRDLLQFLVNDLLKVGGRPESAIAIETDGGEDIEVRTRTPSGEERVKTIHWTVDSFVPDTILIEEQSLVKVISSVYSNAIKFTDEGEVILHARVSPRSRYIVIRVRDTGNGIRDEFVPRLFQPFAKEDDSLTRTSEGLGLGLMVAKGLARKIGGDLNLVSTSSTGQHTGTEFEIRVPMSPSDIMSRPTTPSGSPAPSHRSALSSLNEDYQPMDGQHGHTRARSGSYRSAFARASPRASMSPKRIDTSFPSPLPPHTRPMPTPLQRVDKTPRRTSPVTSHAMQRRDADFDRTLAQRYPLSFLVVEDNKINRKLLVNMLHKLGYTNIHEAYDGSHAVRQMEALQGKIDVVLMDLWMPYMDGYEASEKILAMDWDLPNGVSQLNGSNGMAKRAPTILAVTADVTDGALEKAATVGMKGFLTKPFKVVDLERLILEYCAQRRPSEVAYSASRAVAGEIAVGLGVGM